MQIQGMLMNATIRLTPGSSEGASELGTKLLFGKGAFMNV